MYGPSGSHCSVNSGSWFAAVVPDNTQLVGCIFLWRVPPLSCKGAFAMGLLTHALSERLAIRDSAQACSIFSSAEAPVKVPREHEHSA